MQQRVRINISTSTKGVKTWDCTVECVEDGIEFPTDETLKESDRLVAELESRYPVRFEEEKK